MVDIQQGQVLAVQTNQPIVQSTDTPTLAVTNTVQTGSTINGIYINAEGYATTAGALSNIYMSVTKNPSGNIVVPAANTVGSSDNKRFVIHQEMKMLEQSVNGNPRTIFNGVIVIPKAYRRFAPNDVLVLSFLSPGVNANVCFQCHYKEFR